MRNLVLVSCARPLNHRYTFVTCPKAVTRCSPYTRSTMQNPLTGSAVRQGGGTTKEPLRGDTWRPKSRRLCPSSMMAPWWGSARRKSATMRLLLPLPVLPTMPTASPLFTSNVTPCTAVPQPNWGAIGGRLALPLGLRLVHEALKRLQHSILLLLLKNLARQLTRHPVLTGAKVTMDKGVSSIYSAAAPSARGPGLPGSASRRPGTG